MYIKELAISDSSAAISSEIDSARPKKLITLIGDASCFMLFNFVFFLISGHLDEYALEQCERTVMNHKSEGGELSNELKM